MAPFLRRLLQSVSLTTKVAVVSALAGTGAWVLVVLSQSMELEQRLLSAALEGAAAEAGEHRELFRRAALGHIEVARILAEEDSFRQATRPDVGLPDTARWLMDSVYPVHGVMLLSPEGKVLSHYCELPGERWRRVRELALHQQGLAVRRDNGSYTLIARVSRESGESVVAYSPVNSTLLRRVAGKNGDSAVMAVVETETGRVVASTWPEGVPVGKSLSSMLDQFHMARDIRFQTDGLESIRLVTLLGRASLDASLAPLIRRHSGEVALIGAALALPLLITTFWLSRRMREVAREVNEVARNSFGLEIGGVERGDELYRVVNQFKTFAAELEKTRGVLYRQVKEKMLLAARAVEAEKSEHERSILQSITDQLGIGIIVDGPDGPVAANRLMNDFVEQCGGIELFLGVEPASGEGERRTCCDREGRERTFRLRRFDVGSDQSLLVEDITELVRSETERNIFARLPAQSPSPVLRIGRSGRIEYANQPGHELLEYSGMGESLPERLLSAVEGAVESGTDRTVELRLGPRIFSFVVAYIEGADFLYLYGTDITERKFAEAELRKSEARFRQLLEAAPDAMVIVDSDGLVEYANRQAQQMFEHPADELLEQPFERLLPERYRMGQVLRREQVTTESSDEVGGGELIEGLRRNGERFPMEVRMRAMERDGGHVVIYIIRDVTERERSAEEIRLLNEQLQTHIAELTAVNSELESFSYSVSHDLRGPLRSIAGFSSILKEDYGEGLDAQAHEYLDRVQAASRRMADLIDSLLSLSRISRAELHRRDVDLSALAREEAAELVEREPDRRVRFEIQPEVTASGDERLLRTVLQNLLGNAWKFTAQRDEAVIAFGATEHEGRRVFFVRDNGAGFDMAYATKLFKAFERLHQPSEYPGSGIGLATVARIVRRHGGEIWAEGMVDHGASFYFTLG